MRILDKISVSSLSSPSSLSSLPALLSIPVMAMIGLTGCGSKQSEGAFPTDFNTRSDAQRVAWMMKETTPDSVARFICLAALGKVEGAKIDTLPMATLYALENYRDSDLSIFSDEYDRFSSTLPLPDKMRIMAMAGNVDPQGLGYDLGLHYADQIREKQMTAAEVRAELAEFRKAADPETYERFLKGFSVVLKIDAGRDLPKEIIQEFQ